MSGAGTPHAEREAARMLFDRRTLLLAAPASLVPAAARARPRPPRPWEARRVLLLGDSITAAGHHAQYLDAYFRTAHPSSPAEVINLGLPSETVTGLSEPDHPWPRPDVHERLDRALRRVRPDLVIACYGMNDGIYHPFDGERFRRYRESMGRLRDRIRVDGAGLVLMTPPPFDPEPVRSKLLPPDAPQDGSGPRFSYMRPAADYDSVLERYSRWLLSLRQDGETVVDLRTPILRLVRERRRREPGFRLAGDGVHLDASGGWLIAEALLREFDAPPAGARLALRGSRGGSGVSVSGAEDGARTVVGTVAIPLALPPGFTSPLSRLTLSWRGLPPGRWRVLEGDREVAAVTAEELARGIDLSTADVEPVRRARRLLETVRRRERIMSPAWLTDVGHRRPDTPGGLPLGEAEERCRPLTAAIARDVGPCPLRLTLVPGGGEVRS